MNRQTSAIQRLGIETRGDSLYHRVRGAAMKACREGRRIEIKLGKKYSPIFYLCCDLIRQEENSVPLREGDVFRQGLGLILTAMAEDHPLTGDGIDFASLTATCRLSSSGGVEAVFIKPK